MPKRNRFTGILVNHKKLSLTFPFERNTLLLISERPSLDTVIRVVSWIPLDESLFHSKGLIHLGLRAFKLELPKCNLIYASILCPSGCYLAPTHKVLSPNQLQVLTQVLHK